ncbi:MAG: hypothetical protein ACRBDI_05480 [Alphaproteobacteria bacterium]
MSNLDNRSFIPNSELEEINKGLTRSFIPRAEAENAYNCGKPQQQKQQQHVGNCLTSKADNLKNCDL